jgi:hypothetical protein
MFRHIGNIGGRGGVKSLRGGKKGIIWGRVLYFSMGEMGVKSLPLTIQEKTMVSDANIEIRTMSNVMRPEQRII